MGKFETAIAFARELLCEGGGRVAESGAGSPSPLAPLPEGEGNAVARRLPEGEGNEAGGCGRCSACRQVDARSHPDLDIVQKEPDKSELRLRLLIGEGDSRMREGLVHRMGLKPARGRGKVAIVADAGFLNAEGANCLLKTLEEPPPGAVIILLSAAEQRQLPTIRSRCQIVRFPTLPEAAVAERLLAEELCEDRAVAERIAASAGGSLERARRLAAPELAEISDELLPRLDRADATLAECLSLVLGCVNAAGSDAPSKRVRLKDIVALCGDHYLARLRAALAGQDPRDPDALLDVIQRCLETTGHVDANAHLPTLTEWWLDETRRALRAR